MYYESFGLTEPPFQLTPDSRYLYLSKMHRRAKAYMDYAVWKRDGFIVITGDIGAGKTTLINKLLTEIGKDLEVIRIFQTQLTEIEFLQAMLFELGVSESDIQNLGKVQLLHRLNHYLIQNYTNGKHVALIIDEAQNLSIKVLEEVRMLSGLEVEKEKLINIVLVGQPELSYILDSPNMTQLVQRIRLRFHVGPLNFDETVEYIHHRLSVAGSNSPDDLFDKDVYPLIFEYTGGIPRKINSLCDTAMVCAFADNKARIDAASFNDAVFELQWISPKNNKDSVSRENHQEKIPTFVAGEQQWREIFSTFIRVMGDVTARMQCIDKRLSDIEQHLHDKSYSDGKKSEGATPDNKDEKS